MTRGTWACFRTDRPRQIGLNTPGPISGVLTQAFSRREIVLPIFDARGSPATAGQIPPTGQILIRNPVTTTGNLPIIRKTGLIC